MESSVSAAKVAGVLEVREEEVEFKAQIQGENFLIVLLFHILKGEFIVISGTRLPSPGVGLCHQDESKNPLSVCWDTFWGRTITQQMTKGTSETQSCR